SAESAVDPTATAFVIARFFGVSGHQNARKPLIAAPSAGSSGTRRSSQGLTIQLPRLVNVDRAAQPVQLNDDRESDRRLTRRDRDDEDREHLTFQRSESM